MISRSPSEDLSCQSLINKYQKDLRKDTERIYAADSGSWVSPSDQIIDKVVLKPPLSNRCNKAVAHMGILQIGANVIDKYLHKRAVEKYNALEELRRTLQTDAERRLNQSCMMMKDDLNRLYQQHMLQLTNDFDKTLSERLELLEIDLLKDYTSVMDAQKAERNAIWEERMEEAIEETVTVMTKNFLEDMSVKQKELKEMYDKQVKKQLLTAKITLEHEQKTCRNTLMGLQHSMECKNVTNMMYVLCNERQKCEKQRQTILDQYRDKIAKLERTYAQKQNAVEVIYHETRDLQRKLTLREESLCQIMIQFQKFINYALQATPTQAEFLLNLKKLLSLDLKKAMESPQKYSQHMMKIFEDWKEEESSSSSSSSMGLQDYHQCLNMPTPPASGSSLNSSELLPAIHYKEKIYVREDVRNRFSRGLSITPSNMLYNRHVESLIDFFAKINRDVSMIDSFDYTPKVVRSQLSHGSSVRFEKFDYSVLAAGQKNVRSIMSNIQREEIMVDRVQYQTVDSLGLLTAKDSRTKHRSSLLSNIEKGTYQSFEELTTPDILSLSRPCYKNQKEEMASEITPVLNDMKSASDRNIVMNPYDVIDSSSAESKLLLARDSIILAKLSMKPNSIIPVSSPHPPSTKDKDSSIAGNDPKTSRLSFIKDSIILRKESLNKHFSPDPIPSPPVSSTAVPLSPFVPGPISNQIYISGNDSPPYTAIQGTTLTAAATRMCAAGLHSAMASVPSGSSPPLNFMSSPQAPLSETGSPFRGITPVPLSLGETLDSDEKLQVQASKTPSFLNITEKIKRDVADRCFSINSATKSYLEIIMGRSKNMSRLTTHQDSLEILREKGMSKSNTRKRSITKVSEKSAKPTHSDMRMSIVTFNILPEVFEQVSFEKSTPTSAGQVPVKEYLKKMHEAGVREKFHQKPNIAKVVGDKGATECNQGTDEFTKDRINSLLNILKQDPALIRMFTRCS